MYFFNMLCIAPPKNNHFSIFVYKLQAKQTAFIMRAKIPPLLLKRKKSRALPRMQKSINNYKNSEFRSKTPLRPQKQFKMQNGQSCGSTVSLYDKGENDELF